MTIEGLQKHWEVIKAWHENPKAVIQVKNIYTKSKWMDESHPSFVEDYEYRLKPQIEAWAVVNDEGILVGAYHTKDRAAIHSSSINGTVIRLVPEKEVK